MPCTTCMQERVRLGGRGQKKSSERKRTCGSSRAATYSIASSSPWNEAVDLWTRKGSNCAKTCTIVIRSGDRAGIELSEVRENVRKVKE
jgi:hypothetical protein